MNRTKKIALQPADRRPGSRGRTMKLTPETIAALRNIRTAKLPPEIVTNLAALEVAEATLLIALEIIEAVRDGDVPRFKALLGAVQPGPVYDFCAAVAFGAGMARRPTEQSGVASCDT